ncbi:unnamed protein product [Moneuplotes crassus]|uniref:Uncharacterized protein n=1 Tax=Euplotes crassus TaxID=5936 RepID=A0AAD1XDV5_EUPCR|nr:unnamed protein product [Moneuplotes crassus]
MEVIKPHENYDQDPAQKVIAVMKNYEIREELLTGLSCDPGFNRFCNEWRVFRWDLECTSSNSGAIHQPNDLMNRLTHQQELIEKMKMPYLKWEERNLLSGAKDLQLVRQRYKNIGGGSLGFTSKSFLYLSTENYKKLRLLKELKLTIRECDDLLIEFDRKSRANVRQFLHKSFPKQAAKFELINSQGLEDYSKKMSIRHFMAEMRHISRRVVNTIALQGFAISQQNFKRILCFCDKLKALDMRKCRLELDAKLDLRTALQKSSLRTLSVCFAASNYGCDPTPRQLNLHYLVSALAQAERPETKLKDVYVHNVGITKAAEQDLIGRYQHNYFRITCIGHALLV